MNSIGIFVGLDYHDAGVQVCALDRTGRMLMNRRCPNNWQGIVGIVKCPAPGSDVHAAVEACTGAADLADELAVQGGWVVDLAHPGYVARMKQGPDKHDWGDSRILADQSPRSLIGGSLTRRPADHRRPPAMVQLSRPFPSLSGKT